MAETVTWTKFCKIYAQHHKISYAAAVSEAGPAWREYKATHGPAMPPPKAEPRKSEPVPVPQRKKAAPKKETYTYIDPPTEEPKKKPYVHTGVKKGRRVKEVIYYSDSESGGESSGDDY